MPRAKSGARPLRQSGRVGKPQPAARDESPYRREDEWPEVLTLAEAAAYLRVPEEEITKIAGSQGLPARRIGDQWRFSRSAIQDWLRWPSMKESLLQSAGIWKGDPSVDEMLGEIYRQRGRPMTEDGE